MASRIGVGITSLLLVCFAALPLEARDRRQVVELARADQEQMLAGMRRYLDCVEGIVEGLAHNDMKAVARMASRAGLGMLDDVSFEAALSVPADFGLRSMETHQLFDLLAEEARDVGTKAAVTLRLGQILATCNTCHSAYRLAKRY